MSARDNPPYKAERTLLGVGIEGEQKAEVTPERMPGFTEGEISATTPEIDHQQMRVVGGDRETYSTVEGQYEFSGGSWTLNPWDGWPIAYVLGNETVNTDSPDTGLTEHVMTARQDGPPPTATAEYVFIGSGNQDNLVMPYVGVYATSGEISQDNEGLLECSVENEALGVPSDVRDTGPRTSYTTDPSWLPNRDPWKFDTAVSNLSLFGTSFARVTDFSLEITNNTEPEWYIQDESAHEPYEAIYGHAEYSLDVTINISDGSLFEELVTASETGFNANIGFEKQFNSDETLDISCDDARIESAPHNIPEDGAVGVDVSLITPHIEIAVVDSESDGTPYLSAGTSA